MFLACFAAFCFLTLFPAHWGTVHLPDDKGSVCESVDKLCVAAVTYQAEIALRNQVEILVCDPQRDGIRCFDPYSTLKKRQFWNISVIPGCDSGDCIRAISPTARIGR